MEFGITLTYYDAILAAIAASLSGGLILGFLTTYSLQVGLLTGALVATAFVYHAIFRNPPLPDATPQAKAAATIWHLFLGILLVKVYL